MWLDNLMQPAAAARLRAELSFSLLQVQMKKAAAEAGPFASVLLGSADSGELLSAQGAPTVRYLYEIESGRTMTAVQQSVPAWLIFGMFFVVIPDRRRADPGTQRRHLGASHDFRRLARRHAGWQTAGLHAAELGAAGLHAAGGPLARAAAGRRRAAPGHCARLVRADGRGDQRRGGRHGASDRGLYAGASTRRRRSAAA